MQWVLAAITHRALCKLVLNALSKYESQPELMQKIFHGYYPGAQKYEERVTEKSQRAGTSLQRSKCIKSRGSNSSEAFFACYGSDFLNYINCSLETLCNCFTLWYCEKCRF